MDHRTIASVAATTNDGSEGLPSYGSIPSASSTEMFLSRNDQNINCSNSNSSYHNGDRDEIGFNEMDILMQDDEDTVGAIKKKKMQSNNSKNNNSKRWSVLEKLERRHYCRIRNCNDLIQALNSKSLLATLMLVAFSVAFWSLMKAFFTSGFDFGADRYDYIVIGAGPAGSLMTRKLVDRGARVLLLEAGSHTQYDLGGADRFGGPVSRFDIPLFWSTVSTFKEFHWPTFNLKGVSVAKGLGGCGIHNAMLYIRALSSDVTGWNMKGWTWERFLSTYIALETFHDDSNSNNNDDNDDNNDDGNDDNNNDAKIVVPDYHGAHGPISTTKPLYVDQISPEFISSAVNYGLKYSRDFNDPDGGRTGVGYYHFAIKDGMRDSAARAFLGPIMEPAAAPNLKLELEAVVRRVILMPYSDPSLRQEENEKSGSSYNPNDNGNSGHSSDNNNNNSQDDKNNNKNSKSDSNDRNDDTNRDDEALFYVTGVEYEQRGEIKTAYLDMGNPVSKKMFKSSRCVILAAGALLTPKLLMNSGIGPESELKKTVGIDKTNVLVNEWVGRNLQDHPAVGVLVRVTPSLTSEFPSGYSLVSHWNQYITAVERSRAGERVKPSEFGVLASAGLSAGAFLSSPLAKEGIPDIQITFFPSVSEPTMIEKEVEKIKAMKKRQQDELDTKKNRTKTNEWDSEPDEWSVINNLILVTVALINPDARYELVLNSTDPIGLNPDIQVANGGKSYLSEDDVFKLAWGVKTVKAILGHEPIAGKIESVVSPPLDVRTDLEYQEWVRGNNYPNSHWVGTARMGSSPKSSVVNEELKVWNVNGLRVADASAIPTIPNGNVHSTVLVVSSILSDLIADEIRKANSIDT